MTKEETLEIDGEVVECLPNATFRIKIEDGRIILATISGKMRKNNIRVLLGDRVTIEVSLYDLKKGRIKYRYK